MLSDFRDRISITTWPHRHVYERNGSLERCLYCASWRPVSRTRRDLALVGAGLMLVAVLGVLARV